MISKKAMDVFTEMHPDAQPSLTTWYSVAKHARWNNLVDIRKDFPHADPVGRRTVFNISGNKYRMVTRINYRSQRVYVLAIMKHDQYSKEKWK